MTFIFRKKPLSLYDCTGKQRAEQREYNNANKLVQNKKANG